MAQSLSLQITEAEHKIISKVRTDVADTLSVSDHAGGLTFANIGQVMEFSKLMAVSQIGVRKHLRGNPGACLAVCVQAIGWRMDPFAVANKSYLVNDQIAYEAQLLHAVILQRAPIIGRPTFSYEGEGSQRKLTVSGVLANSDGQVLDYTTPLFSLITPKNSPLWKTDPDQQLGYYACRAWCRRHFPDVILGVYAVDELEGAPSINAPSVARPSLASRLQAKAVTVDQVEPEGFSADFVDAETAEVIDGEVSEVEARESEPAESPDDGDIPDEDTLLDKARAAAMEGAKRFRLWKGKLTQAEFDELTPELAALEAVAKAADQAGGE